MNKSPIEWKCPDCRRTLGEVVGGELLPFSDNRIKTRGANLEIVCKDCGFTKVWYTNDAVVKAINQLIAVISSEAAKSTVREIAKAQRKMFPVKTSDKVD